MGRIVVALGWQFGFGQVKELITSRLLAQTRARLVRASGVRQGFNVRVQSGLIGLSGPCKLDLTTYKGCRDAPLDSWAAP